MNQQPADYTALESLFLFQTISTNGVDHEAFKRTSETLLSNALIKSDKHYDAKRLTPDALRRLFLSLLGQELLVEADKTEGPSGGDEALSPNSRKRKLGSPPLPSLKDVYDNVEKIPVLVNRLYARYKDGVVKQIREDEARFDKVLNEIQLLEKTERERHARLAAANGAPILAPKDTKQTIPVRHVPSPAAGTSRNGQIGQSKPTLPQSPAGAVRAEGSYESTPQALGTPGHLPNITAPVRLSPSLKPSNDASSPSSVPQGRPGVLQTPTIQRRTISPHPDISKSGRTVPGPPQAANQAGGSLKWEQPYTPPHQGTQSPSAPSTVPPAGTTQQLRYQLQQTQQQEQTRLTVGQSPTPNAAYVPSNRPLPSSDSILPQRANPLAPSLQAAIPRTQQQNAAAQQAQPLVKAPALPAKPSAPQQMSQGQQTPQTARPISAATVVSNSPTPVRAQGVVAPTPRRHEHPYTSGQRPPASPANVTKQSSTVIPQDAGQAPRSAIPERLAGTYMSTPPRRISIPALNPHTPFSTSPGTLMRGFGTRWQSSSTPSTPRPLAAEPESPAFEPVSPPSHPLSASKGSQRGARKAAVAITRHSQEPATTTTNRNSRSSRNALKRGLSATPSASESRRSQSVASRAGEKVQVRSDVKEEEASTPKFHDDGADNKSQAGGRGSKRKRQPTPPEPVAPPNHVLWTRGFTKVSSSALDQISSHRDANMFASAVRDRDAPNYKQTVLQPQDITSIRAAIKQGNKAAVQAANNLTDGDPGTASVWLPISEDLMPPKGIINSAQLERELVHMFCNAVMYNPDPDRGPGPSFMKRDPDEEEENVGYRVDENGVVRNTQAMFLEVEKLLGDLRSAEKERRDAAPPAGMTQLGSIATPAEEAGEDEEEQEDGEEAEEEEEEEGEEEGKGEEEEEEPSGSDHVTGNGKRRRIATRGQ